MRSVVVGLVGLMLSGTATAQDGVPLTPKSLQAALAAKPEGAEAERLAERIRTYFGGSEALVKGAAAKIDELTGRLGARSAAAAGERSRAPGRVGCGHLHAAAHEGRHERASTPAWRTLSHGTAFTWHYEAGDRRFGGGQLEVYETHPDSREQPGVPKGDRQADAAVGEQDLRGTKRDWWVYVPAQYKPETPAAVMVFQDGAGPKDYVPTVFDNLIAKKDMPVTVGIFIQPGVHADGRANRSFEYDTLSDQYARFLLEEILPEVEKTVKLRHDAASRAISGVSSGGICAFTVAWERPNEFSKVLSWIGSFTNIASGKTRPGRRAQLRGAGPQDAEEADPRVPPGRRERSGQRERQLAAREPDAGEVAGLCAGTTTGSSTGRASTATGTAARFCPTRCAGSGGTISRSATITRRGLQVGVVSDADRPCPYPHTLPQEALLSFDRRARSFLSP